MPVLAACGRGRCPGHRLAVLRRFLPEELLQFARQLVQARYNGFLAIDREFRPFGRQAFARADIAAYGEYKSHFNTRPQDVSPAYETVNLSARLHLDDHAVVSVHVNNVFNEDYLTYRSARSRTSSRLPLYERYGDERSVAVRFDYRF